MAWALILLAVAMLAAPGAALAAGPFAGLDGYWVGTGTVSLRSGTKERMRCKAQYTVNAEGSNLQISLTCDSDTYKFHVNSYVNAAGGSLSGNWSETTRNVSGRVERAGIARQAAGAAQRGRPVRRQHGGDAEVEPDGRLGDAERHVGRRRLRLAQPRALIAKARPGGPRLTRWRCTARR